MRDRAERDAEIEVILRKIREGREEVVASDTFDRLALNLEALADLMAQVDEGDLDPFDEIGPGAFVFVSSGDAPSFPGARLWAWDETRAIVGEKVGRLSVVPTLPARFVLLTMSHSFRKNYYVDELGYLREGSWAIRCPGALEGLVRVVFARESGR